MHVCSSVLPIGNLREAHKVPFSVVTCEFCLGLLIANYRREYYRLYETHKCFEQSLGI